MAARETILGRDVAEQVFEQFGFDDMPAPTLDNLHAIYKAWSRKVGYDNVQKRVYFSNGGVGPFPLSDPNDFLRTWIQHRTAGSCWVVAEAFFGLLAHAGYRVRRVSGQMLDCDDPLKPNHGTVIITLDGVDYTADPSMCGEEAVALIPGQATAAKSQAHGMWSTGDGRYWWRPGHSRKPIVYVTQFDKCSHPFFVERYEKTREFSLFNTTLYVRRNIDDGVLTYGRGNVVSVTPEGELSARPIDPRDVPRFLVEKMGLSEEIVARIPADDGGPTFGNVK
jgi:arylamine N-acetyltransferase